jgi:hypothetical protein
MLRLGLLVKPPLLDLGKPFKTLLLATSQPCLKLSMLNAISEMCGYECFTFFKIDFTELHSTLSIMSIGLNWLFLLCTGVTAASIFEKFIELKDALLCMILLDCLLKCFELPAFNNKLSLVT